MDALLAWRPWGAAAEASGGCASARTRGGWLHYDDDEPVCAAQYGEQPTVQGLVTLARASAATGGFCAVPDTHLDCAVAARPVWRYVECEQGSLILWDSRTLHASEPGCDCSQFAPRELLRLAVPVCMVPRGVATPDALAGTHLKAASLFFSFFSPNDVFGMENLSHRPRARAKHDRARGNETLLLLLLLLLKIWWVSLFPNARFVNSLSYT